MAVGILAFTPTAVCQSGMVAGRVLGSAGEPVAGARVYALAIHAVNSSGRYADVLTNSKGEFTLKNLRPETYELHAYAPDLGYPDNLFAVFRTAPFPTVVIKKGESKHGVVIHLGPKSGTLSGEIVDKRNGKPLPSASVTIKWADRPEYYVRSSVERDGRFTFNVPLHPLLITVECKGYRPWGSDAVNVPSGGQHHLVVKMTP